MNFMDRVHVLLIQHVQCLRSSIFRIKLFGSVQKAEGSGDAVQRIAQMGGFLVSSEMALFQMCGGAKVGRWPSLLAFEPKLLSTPSDWNCTPGD